MQTVPQVLNKWGAVYETDAIERKTQIFGERAFARAVKAGYPDPDLVFATGLHGLLHLVEELVELGFNAVGYDILADLRFESVFLGCTVSDDFFDGALDILIRIEQCTDGHIRLPLGSCQFRKYAVGSR